jgi:hypothetical protein
MIAFTFARPPEYFGWHLQSDARRAAGRWVAAAAGLALLGCAVVAFGDDVEGGTAVWVGVLFAGATGFLLWHARRRYVALMAVPPFWLAPRRYLIDDEALQASTELSAVTYRWPLVQKVAVVPAAYLFAVQHFGVFDLPRAPLSEQQDAELRAFLAARNLIPAAAAGSAGPGPVAAGG